jgi:hypothetical protein
MRFNFGILKLANISPRWGSGQGVVQPSTNIAPLRGAYGHKYYSIFNKPLRRSPPHRGGMFVDIYSINI